ncbi:MAG TPA: hypothetical protein PK230_04970, partial [Chitinophagales bacterium]|nr:hypothetical protein [Chitinophagales bacterium]
NGCTGTDVQIVNQSNNLNPTIGGVSQVCPGNTTTLDATGSFSSYLWSNNNEVTPTITVGVGTYTVTVSDVSGCTGTSSLNVINFVPSASASAIGSPACPGNDISLNASVGTAYSWSGPAGFSSSVQSPTITIPNNTPANTYTYTVTVTDSNTCTATATVDVVVNSIPSPSITGNTDICSGQSTILTASGGNSYAWNDPANTTGSILTVSPSNTITYIVTVTNAQGCSATTTTTVNVTTTPTAAISGNNPICLGDNITLTASGGATYVWNDPANTANATVIVSPTTNTAYTVTATNGQCSDTETVTVTVNSLPTAVAGGGGNVCTGSDINLTASGGNTYQWAGPNSFSSVQQNPTITAAAVIASGVYTVTISNSNNCSSTATVSVIVAGCSCPNPPTISALPTAQICSNNTANLSVTLGGGATTATWTSSGSGTFNTTTGNNVVYTPSATDITTGSVTITITTDDPDGNGTLCNVASTSITLSINALPNASISGNNSVCEGNSVALTASGGANYLWNDINATNTTQLTVTPTANTTYTVTVTNGSGCSATASHVVNVNTTPVASIIGDNSICENATTTLTATGGNSYIWSGSGIVNPNNDSQNLSGLTPNTYTYTVTVSNIANCSTIINTTLTISANPIAGIGGTNTICENGSTTLTASGNGNYTWSGATVTIPTQNTQNVSNLSNGSYPYTLTVTDSNGCTDTESLTITVNSLPTPTINGSTTFCVDTQLDAGAGYDSYLWSAGNQNTSSITVGVSDTYTVTVTDNGCSSSTSITVTQANNLTPTISGNTDICAGGTTTLNTGNFATYQWTGGVATPTLDVNAAGTYTVTVTDASGCSGTASTTVNVVTLPNFTAGQDNLVCSYIYVLAGTGTNGSWSVASGGTASFTNLNSPTTTVNVTTCGIYELVWTEDNGSCTATDTVKIGFIESVPANSCPP